MTIAKVLLLDAELRKVASISGVNNKGEIWFLPEATPEQKAAAQSIVDNWVDPPDPNFDGMIAELVYGSNYPAVQTWYDGLRRTQSDYLQKLLTDQDLAGIQQFFDLVDTTPATAELTALLAAFDMPITLN